MSFPPIPTAGVASSLISALAPASQLNALAGVFNSVQKAAKDKKGTTGIADIFKSITSVPFTIFSIITDFLNALGIVEPILDLITMLIEILSAAMMKKMMPAFMKLLDAITESGLINLIVIIGEIIGDVLVVVFDALIIALEKMNPLFDALSIILGSEGMSAIILILAKIIGTLVIVGFVPLIYIIYALGMVVAFVMDIIAGIVAWFTGQEAPGFANVEAWQTGFGGMLLETVADLGVGIAELWAMGGEEGGGGGGGTADYTAGPQERAGGFQTGEGDYTVINVYDADIDEEELAALMEYRKAMGR